MKQRYRLFKRGWGVFYCEDNETRKQESLNTSNRAEAQRLVQAKNEGLQHRAFSLQLARVYWKAGDPAGATRTWQSVMDEIVRTKLGETQQRWHAAIRDTAFDGLRKRVLLETNAEDFLRALEKGTVCTNIYLRRIHNFALDMNWIPWPVIPRRQWPAVRHKDKRAITPDEHGRIVDREPNQELRAFYTLLWHLGGSQSDVANLTAEDIDWPNHVIAYRRMKTATICQVRFSDELEKLLRSLPDKGALLPRLARMHEKHRAKEFRRRCQGLGIYGVSLHSYRYAWAERARKAGYPERFAQEALGHNSKAVHRAYARKARVTIPALEDYEKQMKNKVIQGIGFAAPASPLSETV